MVTVSAYEATGMTEGLPGAAAAPLVFGFVLDSRAKRSRWRLQAPSKQMAMKRLSGIPARMEIILPVRRDYMITRLTR